MLPPTTDVPVPIPSSLASHPLHRLRPLITPHTSHTPFPPPCQYHDQTSVMHSHSARRPSYVRARPHHRQHHPVSGSNSPSPRRPTPISRQTVRCRSKCPQKPATLVHSPHMQTHKCICNAHKHHRPRPHVHIDHHKDTRTRAHTQMHTHIYTQGHTQNAHSDTHTDTHSNTMRASIWCESAVHPYCNATHVCCDPMHDPSHLSHTDLMRVPACIRPSSGLRASVRRAPSRCDWSRACVMIHTHVAGSFHMHHSHAPSPTLPTPQTIPPYRQP